MAVIQWLRYGRESLGRRASSKVVTGLIEELGECDVKAEIHSVLSDIEITLDEVSSEVSSSGKKSCSNGAEAVEYIQEFLSCFLEEGLDATNPYCSYRSRGESRRILFGDAIERKLNPFSMSTSGDSKYYEIEITSKAKKVPSAQTSTQAA